MACAVNQLVACALDQLEYQRLPRNTLRLIKPGTMSLEGEQRGDKEKGKVGIIKKVCAAIKLKFFIMICDITVQRFPVDMQLKYLRITRHLQCSKSFAAGFARTLKIFAFTQIENIHLKINCLHFRLFQPSRSKIADFLRAPLLSVLLSHFQRIFHKFSQLCSITTSAIPCQHKFSIQQVC